LPVGCDPSLRRTARGIYTGLNPDPTYDLRIDPLKSKKFQFSLDRPEIDKKKWGWSIVGAKGIVSN
jgi:hypothetical protein